MAGGFFVEFSGPKKRFLSFFLSFGFLSFLSPLFSIVFSSQTTCDRILASRRLFFFRGSLPRCVGFPSVFVSGFVFQVFTISCHFVSISVRVFRVARRVQVCENSKSEKFSFDNNSRVCTGWRLQSQLPRLRWVLTGQHC